MSLLALPLNTFPSVRGETFDLIETQYRVHIICIARFGQRMNRLPARPYMGGPFNRYVRSRRPHTSIYAVVLFFQLVDRISKLERKPPVTLSLIVVNMALFFLPRLKRMLPTWFHPLTDAVKFRTATRLTCLNPRAVIRGERYRLLTCCVIHASDIHVILNSLSLLYKGVSLESSMGPFIFLSLIVYLAVTSHALYVFLAFMANKVGISVLMDKCVVGFSSVLFGLKVILNTNPNYGRRADQIFHIRLPGGTAPWTELLLASLLMPRVSFLGHLCGIFAGLIYVFLSARITSMTRRILAS